MCLDYSIYMFKMLDCDFTFLFQAQEISHLIACQPTALKAVRLQALVPAYPEREDRRDKLDKLEVMLIMC